MPTIEVVDLTKRFGRVLAVDGLSFEAREGRVTGFLGPNGAEKTTTLRSILGLVRPTSGSCSIDGVAYHQLAHPAHDVGAVLEATGFYPSRKARDHLRAAALAAGIPVERADEVLAVVGLADVAERRVGGFSLGMRQRLGLAAALLGDPGCLVLDEPANGLDPQGIAWLRRFLKWYASQGRAVLVASSGRDVADRGRRRSDLFGQIGRELDSRVSGEQTADVGAGQDPRGRAARRGPHDGRHLRKA
jgi:ABC-2 type transport system ATP-binding protein